MHARQTVSLSSQSHVYLITLSLWGWIWGESATVTRSLAQDLPTTSVATVALHGPPTPDAQRRSSAQIHPSQDQLEACADCHFELVESFKTTFMSRALRYPTLDQVVEDFSGARSTVIHPKTGVGYRALIDDQGRWWQEEFNPEGEYVRRVEVKYLIGSGNNTRSYIGEVDGELFELPLTWYSATSEREGLWDMSPGYQRADHFRFSRPVKADCLFCHNDLSPMDNRRLAGFKERLPPGITCARCHGDGAAHIEARLEGQTWGAEADPTILNPKHLEPYRQQQICEQCHLSGEARALLPRQRWDQYDPRTPLEDYVQIYAFPVAQVASSDREVQGGEAGEKTPVASAQFGIASHAERMKLSECAQGPGSFTCTTCHDPHAPDTAESYQRACLSCHQHDEHARAQSSKYQRGLNGAQPCFRCHMQTSGTSDIPHVRMTDHWVQKRPVKGSGEVTYEPELTPLLPEPSEHLSQFRDGLLGLSYTDLVRYNKRSEYVPRAMQLLTQTARRYPEWPEVWSALGELSSMLGDRVATIAAYERYAELRPQDEHYRLREASALNVHGQSERAKEVLRALIKQRPEHYQALELLANIELRDGHHDEADRLYREAEKHGSHAHSISHNRGILSLMKGDIKSARAHFEEGMRRDGVSREGPFYLGLVSATEGDHDRAIKLYKQALRRDGAFVQAVQQLTRSLVALGRDLEAVDELRAFVSRDKDSVDAKLLLAQQLDRLGRYQEVYDLLLSAQHLKDPRLKPALGVARERLKLASPP